LNVHFINTIELLCLTMNKPYNIQNMNSCNCVFHISFCKALLINEVEPSRSERESGLYIHVVYVVIYLRMLFIFFLNVHFINTIELLCLTILITLFLSL
jgi:hypothetical protein